MDAMGSRQQRDPIGRTGLRLAIWPEGCRHRLYCEHLHFVCPCHFVCRETLRNRRRQRHEDGRPSVGRFSHLGDRRFLDSRYVSHRTSSLVRFLILAIAFTVVYLLVVIGLFRITRPLRIAWSAVGAFTPAVFSRSGRRVVLGTTSARSLNRPYYGEMTGEAQVEIPRTEQLLLALEERPWNAVYRMAIGLSASPLSGITDFMRRDGLWLVSFSRAFFYCGWYPLSCVACCLSPRRLRKSGVSGEGWANGTTPINGVSCCGSAWESVLVCCFRVPPNQDLLAWLWRCCSLCQVLPAGLHGAG